MDLFARLALFVCIVASGLGGLAITFVAFRYGLVPPEQDDPVEVIRRRLFATQLAHAFAAVAFSVTAFSAAAVMIANSGTPTADGRAAVSDRLDNVESLVRTMTSTLERTVDRLEQEPARVTR